MEKLIEKFKRYVKIETASIDEEEIKQPSNPKEWDLLKLLDKELRELGIESTLSEKGYVYGLIKGNTIKEVPSLCFIAHIDTSPDASGENVNPRIWENYDCRDLYLNDINKEEKPIILKLEDNPYLKECKGKTIITSDGRTLLGADDKAGVAEIMCMAEYLVNNPSFEHGDIYIVFTPDEEIGRGTENFDFEKCKAKFGYTVDGGTLGELEYENFNAGSMICEFNGRTIHPGDAKNKMKNAIRIANEFDRMLPENMRPEYTENYEGFFHLHNISGTVEFCKSEYLIREHDKNLFEKKKELAKKVGDYINLKYGDNTVKVIIKDSYYNMSEIIKNNFHLITNAIEGMKKAGVCANVKPIRGGTDGARLSFMNLPCANLSTGGQNYHSRYEYAVLEDMEKMVEVILNIIGIYSK